MAKVEGLKRTQIQGKKYDLPAEEVEVHKLIQRGISINKKLKILKSEMDEINRRLSDIASGRRDGATTVKFSSPAGHSVVTFRENYVCDDAVEEIFQEIGSLADRFFTKKIEFKTSKDLKQFLDGAHTYGIENPDIIKELLLSHVKKKTTKPNVKIVGAE